MRADVTENALSTAAAIRGPGELTASSAYAQVMYWPLGSPAALPDLGLEAMPRLDPTVQSPVRAWNLQLVLRGEYASVKYNAGDPVAMSAPGPSQSAGDYRYQSAAFGVNLWWTRHLRLTLNYALHHVEGSNATLPAPGQDLLHEFGARVALAL